MTGVLAAVSISTNDAAPFKATASAVSRKSVVEASPNMPHALKWKVNVVAASAASAAYPSLVFVALSV